MLILSYTIQLVIPNICAKFQNLAEVVPKICDEKFYLRKRKNDK